MRGEIKLKFFDTILKKLRNVFSYICHNSCGKSALRTQLVIIETLIFETIGYFNSRGPPVGLFAFSLAPLSTVNCVNTTHDTSKHRGQQRPTVLALFRCFHCLHLVGLQKVIRTIVHNSSLIIPLYSLLLCLLRSLNIAPCTIMLFNYERR